MYAVLFVYSATGFPSRGLFGTAPSIFAWPLLYFVILLWVGVGEHSTSRYVQQYELVPVSQAASPDLRGFT